MNKIASMNLDVVDFILNDVEKLASVVNGLTDSTKTAHIPSFEEQQDMPDRNFALILLSNQAADLHKFAMNSADLVELNLAFLSNNVESLPDEVIKIAGANLTKAANDYNVSIPANLEEFSSNVYVDNRLLTTDINELNYVVKCAQEGDVNFAWEGEKKYPLTDASTVKTASAYFAKHHQAMDMDKKLEFVLNTERAAKNFGVDIDNTAIDKYASLDRSRFNPILHDHIKVRQSYIKDDEDIAIYDDLYNKIDAASPTKVAQALNIIDKEFDLERMYGKGIEDPLMACLGSVKRAGLNIEGSMITQDDLNGLDSGDLTVIVGNDAVKALKGDEGVHVLNSLPTPVKREVLELL